MASKLYLLLLILGTLAPLPVRVKALLIPMFVFPIHQSYGVIQANKSLGTPQEEIEKQAYQLNIAHQKEVDEFYQVKAEFLEEWERTTKQQLEWLQEEKSTYEKEYDEKVALLNEEIKRLADQWEEANQELIKQHEEELAATHLEYQHRIDELESQVRLLTHKVEYYENVPQKCPGIFGQVADEVNSLIDELERIQQSHQAQFKYGENMICDYVHHSLKDGKLKVWLNPKNRDSTKKIMQLSDQLTVFNYEKVTIEPNRGALLFTLSNEIYDEALTEDLSVLEAQLEAPDPRLVKVVFSKFVHCFVWGNTGTGKSTLISNLIDLIDYCSLLENSGSTDVTLYDPKFPHSQLDSNNALKLEGIPVKWSRWASIYNACVDLLYEVDQRLEGHYDEAINQLETDTFKPLSLLSICTYIMDELELSIADQELTLQEAYDDGLLGVEQVTKFNLLLNRAGANYGEYTVDKVIARVLKLSRSSNVRLIGVGQSPMPIHYKLLKIDFLNCTRIWLGDVAETVMLGRGNEFVQMPPEDRKKIRQQVQLRKNINVLRFRQGLDPIRYMVVHSPGLPVFIMDCPGVNSFVKDLFGVHHKYSSPKNRLPDDAYGSATALNLKVKPDAVEIPPHSDRDQLIAQFKQMYDNALTERQDKIRAYLEKYSDKSFTIAGLRNRLRWLSQVDDQQLRVDIEALLKLKLIKLLPGKPAKIQYEA